MDHLKINQEISESLKNWKEIVKKYQEPNNKKAVIQLLTSFLPYLGLWVLMYFSLNRPRNYKCLLFSEDFYYPA
jgi:omega-6 fatty acid desaturase (delta-12 desaturase)